MYKTVIWATDASDGADAALREAVRLAESSGGRVVAVHCDQRMTGRSSEWPLLPDEDDRQAKIRHEVQQLRALGVEIDLIVRRSKREAPNVVASVASELDADLIVCGTRGLGAVSGVLHGSFTTRLLHVAPCPILVVREGVTGPAKEHKKTTKVTA